LPERRDSTVVPQALYLMNNSMVYRLAEEFARRVYAIRRRVDETDRARLLDCAQPAPTDEEKQVGARR